jgi:acyl-CoA thioesterase
LKLVPFEELLDMKLIHLERGLAVMEMAYKKELTQPTGVVHGGVIASLVDTVSAIAMKTLNLEKQYYTAELKVRYLSPFRKGKAVAKARIVSNKGRRAVGEIEVEDQDGKILARSTAILLSEKS